jgi:competence protein ComFC
MQIVYHIIDFIFPPSPEERILRTFSPKDLKDNLPRASQNEFPYIKSIYSYHNPLVRELVWQIKYKKNKHAVRLAGYSLFQELSEPVLLIPIPLSKKRRKERGYNQCELLIDALLMHDMDNKFSKDFNLLVRSKHIEKQTLKNRAERQENTKNIFEVTKKCDRQKKILIIDDVSTTGSTLKEAREALLRSGYTDVTALTLAH